MNLLPRRGRPDRPDRRTGAGPVVRGLVVVGLTALGLSTAPAAGASTTPSTTSSTAQATAPSPGVTSAPTCAWPQQVSADTRNVFLPDSAATYWVQPFDVHDDLEIVLSGAYPDARYMSFNVYDGTRGSFESNGVSSGLADHRIAPDPGSANPWQQPSEPGGRFTVTARMAVAPNQPNVLPLAPAGTAEGSSASLIYRVYLPANGDASTVALPTVTLRPGGVSRTLPPCAPGSAGGADLLASADGAMAAPDGSPPISSAAPADPISFVRPTASTSVFPNADNAYLAGWVQPPGAAEVIVIKGTAPRATSGTHPTPWPGPQDQVRYWSMCTNLQFPLLPVVVNRLPGGEVDHGCRHDAVTELDATGSYTFVIGTERQRAAIERVPGVTFLPFSLAQPAARHLVLLRNMIPVDDFAEAVQRVPQDDDPASAAAVMGPYYPRASVCALATLVSTGPSGCAPAAAGPAPNG